MAAETHHGTTEMCVQHLKTAPARGRDMGSGFPTNVSDSLRDMIEAGESSEDQFLPPLPPNRDKTGWCRARVRCTSRLWKTRSRHSGRLHSTAWQILAIRRAMEICQQVNNEDAQFVGS